MHVVQSTEKYKIDVCAFQEIRWPGKGTAIKRNTLFYIVDIKMTNINFEHNFMLGDTLWIIY